MKWVTRERVKVDRVACPWLIRKFIDPRAEFLFVPADAVLQVAEREGAIPFDVPNVEFGHHGPECSFDALVKKHDLTNDPALVLLEMIVNGADTDNSLWQQPESAGLNAVAESSRSTAAIRSALDQPAPKAATLEPRSHPGRTPRIRAMRFTTSSRGLRLCGTIATTGLPKTLLGPNLRTIPPVTRTPNAVAWVLVT